jgi:hypothetical protein
MSNHTPLPWKVGNYDEDKIAYDIIAEAPVSKFDVLPMLAAGGNREEAHANAAYIVQACNNYPKMLELLKATHSSLRTFSDYVPKEEQDWTAYDNDVLNSIEALLANLEVKQGPIDGEPDPPVTILDIVAEHCEEITPDFICPACHKMLDALKIIRDAYGRTDDSQAYMLALAMKNAIEIIKKLEDK